jgi:hypothetical protein
LASLCRRWTVNRALSHDPDMNHYRARARVIRRLVWVALGAPCIAKGTSIPRSWNL